ncbi:hypothetical protein ACVBEG_27505, partial [Pseudomonas sp. GG8]
MVEQGPRINKNFTPASEQAPHPDDRGPKQFALATLPAVLPGRVSPGLAIIAPTAAAKAEACCVAVS